MSILLVGFLRDDKAVEDMLELLKVGHVTTRTNDYRVQTLHAIKTCKRVIGSLNEMR
jgi:Tfp pilus assembly pilus retraction ATPase PilT